MKLHKISYINKNRIFFQEVLLKRFRLSASILIMSWQRDLLHLIHIHKLMKPIHWSTSTPVIKNKSSYLKKFRISSYFPVDDFSSFPNIIISRSYSSVARNFPTTRPWFCVVLLEKRGYNKMTASKIVDRPSTSRTFIFQNAKLSRS